MASATSSSASTVNSTGMRTDEEDKRSEEGAEEAKASPFNRLPDEVIEQVFVYVFADSGGPGVQRVAVNRRLYTLSLRVRYRNIELGSAMLDRLVRDRRLHSVPREVFYTLKEDYLETLVKHEWAMISLFDGISSFNFAARRLPGYVPSPRIDVPRAVTATLRGLSNLSHLRLRFDSEWRFLDSNFSIGRDLPHLRQLEIASAGLIEICLTEERQPENQFQLPPLVELLKDVPTTTPLLLRHLELAILIAPTLGRPNTISSEDLHTLLRSPQLTHLERLSLRLEKEIPDPPSPALTQDDQLSRLIRFLPAFPSLHTLTLENFDHDGSDREESLPPRRDPLLNPRGNLRAFLVDYLPAWPILHLEWRRAHSARITWSRRSRDEAFQVDRYSEDGQDGGEEGGSSSDEDSSIGSSDDSDESDD
ncbi:hypothetical protein JCM8097_007523 [Rhodosporidiobolus ruineniae]